MLYNDYSSDYESLLQRANKPTMEIKRLRTLALEVFKTINNLNPSFMKDLFRQHSLSARRSNNLYVTKMNTTTYGQKSLKSLGPKVWNSLPEHLKAETTFLNFQNSIKTWFGKKCLCNLCKFISDT